ncbi:DUF3139 domain-containing protein [Brevibacillus agri]|uniref:DUF3139 domain-containing protein n=2 Tax=Brevibacillus TaxID=55080 RepID=UPI002E1F90EC|nr:DUF3139 domain-containing protein [Brevibacillus agri]MED1655537.1 DUF3139 domain-containing protein [Brevibacillus agri]MED1687323.1 DUF3139 domain-containing protein [Brevibacillus agri]MED1692110.1 DUF3139 domain-containing protein [Brevibacillus agri]MED1697898.1 DUF3139 domain-containing protein [Brevibacillus agri]
MIIVFLILILIAAPVIYVQGTLLSLENQVRQYLITEKNLDEKTIASVDGVFGKLPLFSVEVIFADEPDVRYFYTEKNGEIIPLSATLKPEGYEYKHK